MQTLSALRPRALVAPMGTQRTDFPFVEVDGFTPNRQGWSTVGQININNVDSNGGNTRHVFPFGTQRSLVVEVLGPTAFRLRFNPAQSATYDSEYSVSVVNRDLGLTGLQVNKITSANQLVLDTGAIQIIIGLDPFEVSVKRGAQLVHRDQPGQGVLYIPGDEVIAVMKTQGQNAHYLGLGEATGSQLFKEKFTFTFSNFDNYAYNTGPCLGDGGPLNPTEPLYCSIPFLIEWNPFPAGDFNGAPYACGIFLDNPGQSFCNIGADDYSDMSGKYYFGALYNELDYYVMIGNSVPDVVHQYTSLTGRSPMPPRYVFGFHQGAYGYYDSNKVQAVANAYRNNLIPCDGLHLDVDFQNNYRTFTHSEIKFPNAAAFFASLHANGFKLSTNITPLLTDNQLGESGSPEPYQQADAMKAANALLFNTTYGDSQPNTDLYDGGVSYGSNVGTNPYPNAYQPLNYNGYNSIALAARGWYPDFGRTDVRTAWGQQYQHLIQDLRLDMIWQDMTCPAIGGTAPAENKSFPGDLMLSRERVGLAGNVTAEQVPGTKAHNTYALNLLHATWDGINQLRADKRNFIIARGGFAGLQRYAATWSGDSASSWDFLRVNLPQVLNMGLSGVPLSGTDIGGFAPGKVDGLDTTSDASQSGTPFVDMVATGGITNYELLTRWMQLGSFLPWYRNHYNGYIKAFQEPYAYGEPVPTHCRKYIELRYRMLQIYYDAMYKCTQSGMPIVRPLFLNDPGDSGVYDYTVASRQFYVGDDFLVAPVLDPHESTNPSSDPTVNLYLPNTSSWYAFKDNQAPLDGAVPGGTSISYYAGLDLVPIYVRAGAILPLVQLEQFVGQLPENPITFNFYPGPDRSTADNAYLLYEDDGVSMDFKNGVVRKSRVYQHTYQGQNNGVVREVRVEHFEGTYSPPANYFYVAILGSITAPVSVKRDSTQIVQVDEPNSLESSTSDSWYWNQSIQIAFAKVFDNRPDTTIAFQY
jgi:alpha-glucosidase